MNTVLEKFFELPEPPQPEKTDDDKDGSDNSDEENKEMPSKLQARDPPTVAGTEDFRPPFAGDDDAEDDIQKLE